MISQFRRIQKHLCRFGLYCLLAFGSASLWAEDTAVPQMDLRACIEKLSAHNYELRARYLDTGALEAGAAAARRERWPTLTAVGSVERHSQPQRIEQPTADKQTTSFSRSTGLAGVQLSLPLYTGGRLQANERIQRHLAAAAEAGAVDFRDRSLLDLVEGYHQLQALGYLIESVDASVEALGAQVEQIDAMIRQQKAADVDRLRVQVRLSTLEQQRIQILDEQVQIRESLNFLMGVPAGTDWGIDPMPEAQEVPEPSASSLREDWATERPDEVAAGLRREAAEAGVDSARALWQPNVQLIGSWTSRSGFADTSPYEDGFLGLTVSWDIWDGGSRHYRVAEARQTQRAASMREAGVRAGREAEWARAKSAFASAQARLQVALSNREAAVETLRIEQRKYEEGHGTITEVLDAEAAALETESLIAAARADYFGALARRDYAAGLFFQPSAGHPDLRRPLLTESATAHPLKQP